MCILLWLRWRLLLTLLPQCSGPRLFDDTDPSLRLLFLCHVLLLSLPFLPFLLRRHERERERSGEHVRNRREWCSKEWERRRGAGSSVAVLWGRSVNSNGTSGHAPLAPSAAGLAGPEQPCTGCLGSQLTGGRGGQPLQQPPIIGPSDGMP